MDKYPHKNKSTKTHKLHTKTNKNAKENTLIYKHKYKHKTQTTNI